MGRVTPELRDAAVRAIGGRAMLSELPQCMQEAIGDLLHAAMAVEREACAKIAETLAREHGSEIGAPPICRPRGLPEFEQSARIAAAIRNRT